MVVNLNIGEKGCKKCRMVAGKGNQGGKKMYTNLKNILKQKKISMKDYAEFINVSEKTARNKIDGVTEFSLKEYLRTCKLLLPEYNRDFLFEDDNSDDQ